MTFDTSQSNTDGGLSATTDYQKQGTGDLVEDSVMAEISRRLIIGLFSSGLQAAINSAIQGIEFPEPGAPAISDSDNQLLRLVNNALLLEPKDIPVPNFQHTSLDIGGAVDEGSETHVWDTPMQSAVYMFSAHVSADTGNEGRWWINKTQTGFTVAWKKLTESVTLSAMGWDIENLNQ